MTGAEADDDIPLGERKTVTDFCYLLDKSKQLFNGLRSVRTSSMETFWSQQRVHRRTGFSFWTRTGQTSGSGLSLRNNKWSGEGDSELLIQTPVRNRGFGPLVNRSSAVHSLLVMDEQLLCCFSWYSHQTQWQMEHRKDQQGSCWADGGQETDSDLILVLGFTSFWLKMICF